MAQPTDRADVREVRLNQQAQGTILARLQFELENHLEEAARHAGDVSRYLMDPERGAVVRLGGLEVRVQDAERHTAQASLQADRGVAAAGTAAALADAIDARLKAVEKARAEEAAAAADKRQWTWRQVVVPFLVVVVALALERLMAVWWP